MIFTTGLGLSLGFHHCFWFGCFLYAPVSAWRAKEAAYVPEVGGNSVGAVLSKQRQTFLWLYIASKGAVASMKADEANSLLPKYWPGWG